MGGSMRVVAVGSHEHRSSEFKVCFALVIRWEVQSILCRAVGVALDVLEGCLLDDAMVLLTSTPRRWTESTEHDDKGDNEI